MGMSIIDYKTLVVGLSQTEGRNDFPFIKISFLLSIQ